VSKDAKRKKTDLEVPGGLATRVMSLTMLADREGDEDEGMAWAR